jgi:glycosyltransferase involved in cell wall biosynthesis
LETFGLTVAEAQAIGKPVVVTDSGGVRDIVTKETGIICESHVNELAKALIEIQVNYEKYDPHKIRELTYNKFSESVIGLQLEKIYSEILNQN